MKISIVGAFLVALATLCSTSRGNPEQKIRLKVTDQGGTPIEDAKCTVGWWKDVFVRDTTNADGIVELQGRTGMTDTMVRATASGYYKSEVIRFLMDTSKGRPATRWEPWPVELTFVMKKIIRPHPMYFVTSTDDNILFMPPGDFGTSHGYDLIERDWIAPQGKGKVADFRIAVRQQTPGDVTYSPKGWTIIKFSNPHDGIIEYTNAATGGSILQGPHEAPLDGYHPEASFANWRDEAVMAKQSAGRSGT